MILLFVFSLCNIAWLDGQQTNEQLEPFGPWLNDKHLASYQFRLELSWNFLVVNFKTSARRAIQGDGLSGLKWVSPKHGFEGYVPIISANLKEVPPFFS